MRVVHVSYSCAPHKNRRHVDMTRQGAARNYGGITTKKGSTAYCALGCNKDDGMLRSDYNNCDSDDAPPSGDGVRSWVTLRHRLDECIRDSGENGLTGTRNLPSLAALVASIRVEVCTWYAGRDGFCSDARCGSTLVVVDRQRVDMSPKQVFSTPCSLSKLW